MLAGAADALYTFTLEATVSHSETTGPTTRHVKREHLKPDAAARKLATPTEMVTPLYEFLCRRPPVNAV
jgi:hypothetical protein